MNAQNTIVAMVVTAAGLACAAEADVVTNWTGSTSSTVTGTLGGVSVTGQAIGTAPFVGLFSDRFSPPNWAAGLSLPSSALGVGVSNAVSGTSQQLTFSAPVTGLRMYIDFVGFDGVTVVLSAAGATSANAFVATPDIAFGGAPSNFFVASIGGQGDCVVTFSGDVTRVLLQFPSGINGAIAYTFTAVPAPSAAALAASAGLLRARRRRR